jgi:hypothetical protein
MRQWQGVGKREEDRATNIYGVQTAVHLSGGEEWVSIRALAAASDIQTCSGNVRCFV